MIECPHEADVFEAVAFGRWPAQVDCSLAAHAADCETCRDLVAVATALQSDRASLLRTAQPPTAAVVWWRATIRSRADAARMAMQPITVLHRVAAACIVGVTGGLMTLAWKSLEPARWFADLLTSLTQRAPAAAALGLEHALIVLALLAVAIVVAPLALYLTLADD
jgi:hypothetical protein